MVLTLRLPLLGAVTAIDLFGAHVQYTRGTDGKVSGGQLNGAIKNVDIQGKLIPNIATTLTAIVVDRSRLHRRAGDVLIAARSPRRHQPHVQGASSTSTVSVSIHSTPKRCSFLRITMKWVPPI